MKALRIPLIFALFSLISLSGCNAGQSNSSVWKTINDGALVVDVRTPAETRSGYIEGAKLIPLDQVADRLREFGADKNRPIVVYCRSGNRSGRAKGILESHGYTNVINGGGYSSLSSSKP